MDPERRSRIVESVRIDPEFALAVTFLTVAGEPDAQGDAPALPVGTAFLIGEPLGGTGKRAPWLVTARHVIDNTRILERLYFRVAKDDGTSATMSGAPWSLGSPPIQRRRDGSDPARL